MASAVNGLAEAGLSTTVQPAASAGAILRVTIVAGKFHGVTATTGPIGWRRTQYRFPAWGEEIDSPLIRRASSANQPKYPSENWTSFFASSYGLPFSSVTSRASSSCRSCMSAWILRSRRPRSLDGSPDHARNAACAAVTARWISGSAPFATLATTVRSAGFVTSKVGGPKGALNRATLEIRALARSLVEDPAYLAALRRRFVAGKAGPMEVLLFNHAYGRPSERPADPMDSSRPVSNTHRESDTAPGRDLSKEGREKLLGLVEGIGSYLNDDPPTATMRDPEP
jgi:hypothetical protein